MLPAPVLPVPPPRPAPWWFRGRAPSLLPPRRRETLTALGPSFIKAGQVLANRPDILREDYMNELTVLQVRAGPWALGAARWAGLGWAGLGWAGLGWAPALRAGLGRQQAQAAAAQRVACCCGHWAGAGELVPPPLGRSAPPAAPPRRAAGRRAAVP